MDGVNYPDLERFLEEALNRKYSGVRREIGQSDLKDLAVKYGLSPEQWDEICQDVKDHKTRAGHFAELENWKEVICELEQAKVWAPLDGEIGFELGRAYARTYQKSKDEDDKKRAEELLRGVIAREPDHREAIRELSDLRERKISAGKGKLVALVLALLVPGFLLGWWFSQGERDSSEDTIVKLEPEPEPHKPEPVVNSDQIKKPKPDSRPKADPKTPVEKTLPVSFPVADLEEEISVDTRKSLLTHYPNGSSFVWNAVIRVGEVEIREMTAELELMSADEQVVFTREFEIFPSYRHGVISGDSIPVHLLVFEKSDFLKPVESAQIIVKTFDRSPLSGELQASPAVPLKGDLPVNFALEIRERNVKRDKPIIGNKEATNLKVVLAVENTGKRSIKSLEFRGGVTGSDGKPLPLVHNSITAAMVSKDLSSSKPGDFTAVYPQYPAMLPGEVRVVEATFIVPDSAPEDLVGYTISVSEIE